MTYVEKCLYDYPKNTAKIEMLKNELQALRSSGDVQGISYDAKNNIHGAHSDPVSQHYQNIESMEIKIYRLSRHTEPVRKMLEALDSPYALDGSRNAEYKKILELFYWGGNSVRDILNHLGWSKTSFYVRRQGLLKMAEEYFDL